MAMFELQGDNGRPIALAEAADSADVETFAIREVSAFHRGPVPSPHREAASVARWCLWAMLP